MSREMLKGLIDLVPDEDIETIYKVVMNADRKVHTCYQAFQSMYLQKLMKMNFRKLYIHYVHLNGSGNNNFKCVGAENTCKEKI